MIFLNIALSFPNSFDNVDWLSICWECQFNTFARFRKSMSSDSRNWTSKHLLCKRSPVRWLVKRLPRLNAACWLVNFEWFLCYFSQILPETDFCWCHFRKEGSLRFKEERAVHISVVRYLLFRKCGAFCEITK